MGDQTIARSLPSVQQSLFSATVEPSPGLQ